MGQSCTQQCSGLQGCVHMSRHAGARCKWEASAEAGHSIHIAGCGPSAGCAPLALPAVPAAKGTGPSVPPTFAALDRLGGMPSRGGGAGHPGVCLAPLPLVGGRPLPLLLLPAVLAILVPCLLGGRALACRGAGTLGVILMKGPLWLTRLWLAILLAPTSS